MNIRQYLRTVSHAGHTLLARLDDAGEAVAASWADPRDADAVAASLTRAGVEAKPLTFPTRCCVEIVTEEPS